MRIPFRHKIGGVPALRSKNNILFLSAKDSCHCFGVATSRPERFLSDKSAGRGRIVLRPTPCLLNRGGRRYRFLHQHHIRSVSCGLTSINHSEHFQLVIICSSCKRRSSCAYRDNPLSPNPLTHVLGLGQVYCVKRKSHGVAFTACSL